METIEHALILCPWTRATWFGSPLQWSISPAGLTSFDNWLLERINWIHNNSSDQDTDSKTLCCTIWMIWKERCKSAFESVAPNPGSVIHQIRTMLSELAMLPDKLPQGTRQGDGTLPAAGVWSPPPLGTIKVNVDAGWHKNKSFCSTGFIARDSTAKVVAGDCRRLRGPSPVIAEALALREGVVTAHNLGWDNIILESDCLSMIDACKGRKQRGDIKVIVEDIVKLQDSFQSCRLNWVNRKSNKVAHLIANICLHDSLPAGWALHPPHQIALALSEDARNVPPR